ncbi:MAG TPA: DUF1015 domain-containing protein [Gemmatimonadales bacterium]|nr:DUF1015 domain-containing protein [Gemmatimonadales bacterium]
MDDLRFAPFKGLRYADPTTLAARLAPPYDVIGPELRRELARRDRANIVHVDLPVAPPGGDQYKEAAELLGAWLRGRVLVRDESPSAYVLRTTSTGLDGVARSRIGVFLALKAFPFEPGSFVRPHERTHAGPKEDRRRLTLATGCNLSPIFVLSPDSQGSLARELDAVSAEPPWAKVEVDGQFHEVWIVTGSRALKLATIASDDPVYIADGHHRYETAVFVKEELAKSRAWSLGAQRTLSYVVSFRDPGLEIRPTHRLIPGRPLERSQILKAASPLFARAQPGEQPDFTVVFADGSEAAMRLRPGADLSKVKEIAHQALTNLPVAICDYVFVGLVLAGIVKKAPEPGYTPDEAEARSAVTQGKCALSILVPPTTLEQVKAVSDAGQFMPPKSTFFAPKVPTGVVLRSFEGES